MPDFNNPQQIGPTLFCENSLPAHLGDMYKGRAAFLIGSGPSLKELPLDALKRPGVLTMGMNNSVKVFRPNLWISTDSPDFFMKSIWLDSTITKFVPHDRAQSRLFDNEQWKWMETRVCQVPTVFYFMRNEDFSPEQFLHEPTVNWGEGACSGSGPGRSVLFAALKILYFIGIRRIFLLGVDFQVSVDKPYATEQSKDASAVEHDRKSFELIDERLNLLRPEFEENDLQVFNCNKASRLTAFPSIEFCEAINHCTQEMPFDFQNERLEGLQYGKQPQEPETTENQRIPEPSDSVPPLQ